MLRAPLHFVWRTLSVQAFQGVIPERQPSQHASTDAPVQQTGIEPVLVHPPVLEPNTRDRAVCETQMLIWLETLRKRPQGQAGIWSQVSCCMIAWWGVSRAKTVSIRVFVSSYKATNVTTTHTGHVFT